MATIRYALLVSGFLCDSVLGQTPSPNREMRSKGITPRRNSVDRNSVGPSQPLLSAKANEDAPGVLSDVRTGLIKLKREVVQAKPTVETTVGSTKPKGVLRVSATKAEEKINRF